MAGKRGSSSRSAKSTRSSKRSKLPDPEEIVLIDEIEESDETGLLAAAAEEPMVPISPPKREIRVREREEGDDDVVFDGEPVPADEAMKRWPYRYKGKWKHSVGSSSTPSEDSSTEFIQAVQHYTKAKEGCVSYKLGDDAHVQSGDDEDDYICNIVEMFKGTDGVSYFRAQWYYRAKDTAIKSSSHLIDNRRVFFSEIMDDNPLGCLLKKLNIRRLPLNMEAADKEAATSDCDFYCDMMYLVPNSTFIKLPVTIDHNGGGSESDSTISSEKGAGVSISGNKFDFDDVSQAVAYQKPEMTLLDLYAGCGGMSTGLSLGADAAGANLVTKWAVDINKYACESLRYNHPETHVRNESAEDFLALLKKWAELCESYVGKEDQVPSHIIEAEDDDGSDDNDGTNVEVYEVERILDICFGDPNEIRKRDLYFKIRWKNYGPEDDTWEPIEGLADCKDRLKEFVVDGHHSKFLPLPGNVDMLCGGPPCQGISGFNRFRETENPFKDEKNKQLLVYMDIIEHLQPRFVLMENVVDILRFAGGFLGRYALGRLIGMNYQTRLGMMAAGSYGLPQFRMRVFLWGARPSENLPQYPLPSYNCVYRGVVPTEFESCYVRHDVGMEVELGNSLFLGDAISDLPPVDNNEGRDEIPYDEEQPQTDFQRFIRTTANGGSTRILFDHRPLQLNDDDYQRVCQIPKQKKANFRNLRGVMVGENNKVKWDPNVERVYLPSGKPLVPDYAMSFIKGTSSKPFGRLWWDETVPTVVTRAEPHNQIILHPSQDRVLTIRENARLQGFPDYYKLFGPIKERYIQVGNAVAVPVSRALGYGLGLALRGTWTLKPVFTLPKRFPNILQADAQATDEIDQA